MAGEVSLADGELTAILSLWLDGMHVGQAQASDHQLAHLIFAVEEFGYADALDGALLILAALQVLPPACIKQAAFQLFLAFEAELLEARDGLR